MKKTQWITPAGRRWMLDRLASIEHELLTLNERRTPDGSVRTELGVSETDPSAKLDALVQRLHQESRELSDIIIGAEVAPLPQNADDVHIASFVRLVRMKGRQKLVRHLYVGGHYDSRIPWSNLPKRITAVVSYDCEVGRALLGKTVGDEVAIPGRGPFAGRWEIDEIKVAQFFRSVEGRRAA